MGNNEYIKPIRTLLVEPDPTARQYLTRSLRARGHTVRTRQDGETAWRAYEKKPYDLIIVDWQLPDIDSLAFIQRIRSLATDSAPVVIAIAAKEKPGDLEPLLAAGIDDFVSVPLYPPQMNIRLAIAERQVRSRAEMPRLRARVWPGSEDLLPSILDMTYEGIISIDQTQGIVLFNKGAERIFGYRAEEALGQPLDMLIPAKFRDIHRRQVTQFAQEGPDARYTGGRPEIEGCRKDGSRFPAEASISRVEVGGKQVLTVVLRDITARKQAEDTLAAERELLATTLKSIGEGVIATDLEGQIVLINHAAVQLTGYSREEALHRPIWDVLSAVDDTTEKAVAIPPSLEAFRQRGLVAEDEAILVGKDGHRLPISSRVTPLMDKGSQMVGMVVTFRDITERRHFEDEVLKAEKLESLGVLASGLAHDFNNSLMNIMLNVSTARLRLADDPEVQELLFSAEQAVKHAKGITLQLLTFARGGQPMKSKLPLVPLLEEGVKFALHGSSVRPRFQFEDDIWAVHIDPDQITQVINNLAINAVQAMPQGGSLHVLASNYRVDSTHHRGPLDPGRYVEVTLRDEGIGIPPDIFDKVFDPYFTTKKAGSGLGLYSCFNILTKHSGWITVSSEVDQGTTFTFYLPAVNLSVVDGDIQETIPSGSGRILVMDDDEGIRMALGKLLTRMGYEVVEAPEGVAALEAYRASQKEGRPFDVVILDLTVAGGHGGLQTFQELRTLNPAIKAIVASGYSTDPILAKYQEYGFAGTLSKPFSAEELGKTLNDVLAES